MDTQRAYVNYKDLDIIYDTATHTFCVGCGSMGVIMEGAGIRRADCHGRRAFVMEDFREVSWTVANPEEGDGRVLTVRYGGGPEAQREMSLSFLLTADALRVQTACRGDLDFRIEGWLRWGGDPESGTFAVSLDRSGTGLRAALGPAASTADNTLFDRATGSALEILGGRTLRLRYDWERGAYGFSMNTEGDDITRGFRLKIRRDIYPQRFGIRYKPYNKGCTFPTPPAGWMTWYAVKFGACEQTVLRNARWMADNLKPYGANCIWVDWEWYHRDMSGGHREGVDVFHPDGERYPRGLSYVADQIRQLGLIPALWIGATNDVNETGFMRENPGVVLCVKPSWCGTWFLDPTHPKVLDEYIPKAFGQLLDWGYEALKWDCLPITLQYCDQHHDRFHDPSVSTEEAMRRIIAKARETVGEDYYMLSCSGHEFRDISMAMDIFDAMRIGGDIFEWDKFVSQCVARVMKYYPYHNVVCMNDADNLVLRPEFNNMDEAVSRVSLVGLLGLPVTYGDDLPDLPADRVELLRRITPPLDIHPMDIRENLFDGKTVKVNLAIDKPYECWNVADVLNLRDEPAAITLSLRDDLHLRTGEGVEYLVFDFWNKRYLGAFKESVLLELGAHASRVLAVRGKLPRPQVVSTSRHITQGAADILSMGWDDERNRLWGSSAVVAGEDYELFVRVPEGFLPNPETCNCKALNTVEDGIYRAVFPSQGGTMAWELAFTRN